MPGESARCTPQSVYASAHAVGDTPRVARERSPLAQSSAPAIFALRGLGSAGAALAPALTATLAALAEGLGEREAGVAREISKTFEECVTDSLSALAARYTEAAPKGEIVIVVGPPGEEAEGQTDDAAIDAALREALERLPPAKAVGEVAKALKLDRQALYARAMEIRNSPPARGRG